MSVITRRAGAADLQQALDLVGALLVELGEEGDEAGELDLAELRSQVERLGDQHPILVAAEGEAIVGVLTISECFAVYANGTYGVINEMYVAPEHRSAGVGALLVRAAAELGRTRGWRRLDVTAPESERWARTRRFYEREGFAFTGPKLKLLLDDRATEGAD